MNRYLTLTACSFIAVLAIAAAPMTAQAGTLTIYNENCTKTKWFSKHNRVTVHVFANRKGCTRTSVTVGKGEYKTIRLLPYWYDALSPKKARDCKYVHQAYGTVGGKNDVRGYEDTAVTCRKDMFGICQCTKRMDFPL